MLIVLGVLAWIICGLVAVYLAGKVDAACGVSGAAPVHLLFLMGPGGLICALIMSLVYCINFSSPISKIYDKGNKREKN